MQRYFGRKIKNQVFLSEEDQYHLLKVMRARRGEQIEVVADDNVFICDIKSTKPLEILTKKQLKENNELPNYVILIAALLKGDKIDFVLQKATELGVSEIVLLTTDRTIVKIKGHQSDLKLGRYQKILKEAACQSKREKIPFINKILEFSQIDEIEANLKFIAYEEKKGTTALLNKKLDSIKPGKRIAIIIGPEGGFNEGEVQYAKNCGFIPVGLGNRILRAETASIYALSVIANRLEDK